MNYRFTALFMSFLLVITTVFSTNYMCEGQETVRAGVATVQAASIGYATTPGAITTPTAASTPSSTTTSAAATTPAATATASVVTPSPTATTSSEPASTTCPTDEPVDRGSLQDFKVYLNYVADETYREQSWNDIYTEVQGDGSYKLTYTAQSLASAMYILALNTNLYNGSIGNGFSITPTTIAVGDTVYSINMSGGFGFNDRDTSKSYVYNIVNPFVGPLAADGVTLVSENQTSINGLGNIKVCEGDVITLYFKVSGTGMANLAATAEPPKASVVTGTKSIKASKSSVTLEPGKSITLNYSVTKTAAASAAETVTAITSSTDVAKISLNKSKKRLKITTPKTVVMGRTAKVMLKSGKKSCTISVNTKAKMSVKAKKTVVCRAKLGKVTKKVKCKKIKVTGYNKKKIKVKVTATGDECVKFNVKGLKKGSTTIKLKYKGKSRSVKIKVT